MACATTNSPSPSERRRDASEGAETCGCHGAGGLPAAAIAPGVSSRGSAQAVSPTTTAIGHSARLRTRDREVSGCCKGIAKTLAPIRLAAEWNTRRLTRCYPCPAARLRPRLARAGDTGQVLLTCEAGAALWAMN